MLTSGALVARDPLISGSFPAFKRQLAPGRYPVLLSLAHWDERDRPVAYATVQIQPGTPVRWEMATRPGEDLSTLGEYDIFGYIVDAGTGSFMDLEAARVLEGLTDADFDAYCDSLIREFHPDRTTSTLLVSRTLDAATGANFVAFTSGRGDDLYASYWGFDENDVLVCLTTDFNLNLSWAESLDAEDASQAV